MWLPAVLTAAGPALLFKAVGTALDFHDTAAFFWVWPCYVSACTALAGWRVVRLHVDGRRPVLAASVVIVAIGLAPLADMLRALLAGPRAGLLLGWLFVLVAFGVAIAIAILIGVLAGRVAGRMRAGACV
jgi:hypothetical protein